MLAAISPAELQQQSIYFSPRTDNNVVRGTFFYRCLYSHEAVMTTGIFIVITLKNVKVNISGKGLISFSIEENAKCVQTICNIEKTILDKLDLLSIGRIESLSNAARSGVIRNIIFPNNPKLDDSVIMILRVSGVWKDDTGYGLVYRFIVPSHPL